MVAIIIVLYGKKSWTKYLVLFVSNDLHRDIKIEIECIDLNTSNAVQYT